MQRQAGNIKGVGDFHGGVRRQHRVGHRRCERVVTHYIAVQHADDLPIRLGNKAVLPGEIHIVAGISQGPDVQQILAGLG
ncbi:hypothetical protein D3C76_1511100 [compost metagenome]